MPSNPPEPSLWDAIDSIRESEPRYRREAYLFVVAALGLVVRTLSEERRCDPEKRHLSGGELLRGVVELARSEFGPLGSTVFREWGVLESEDVGRIVFDLVRARQLSARDEDTIEAFRGPDLMRALDQAPEAAVRRPAGPGPRSPEPR